MESYIIEGGKRLEGEVNISGSKNATLPIMAACILNKGINTLYNVPNIYDVYIMENILEYLGCKIYRNNDKIVIDSSNISKYSIPEFLMRKMRSSVMLVGAIIGRMDKCIFSYPGGCEIGARPIDLHINAFRKLDIQVKEEGGYIYCETCKINNTEINLDFPSVGATENIILVSVLGEGTTVIKNAAREPEIIDLQNILNKMGAKVEGAGSNIITIKGVKKLREVEYIVMPDRIEAGTFICALAATKGHILLNKVNTEHISSIISKVEEAGVKTKIYEDKLEIISEKRLHAIDNIRTMPYPGFPTDMQSQFVSMLVTSKGTSIITENIFENRFKFINELIRMGAKISIEGRTAIIKGVKRISGSLVEASDLRGGAALIVAGLVANGKTRIININHILRGYEDIEGKLRKIGANIIRSE